MMAGTSSQTEKHWVGTSVDSLHQNKGPWAYDVSPITTSRYHSVLYQLPATLINPPKPYLSLQAHHWDNDYVRMPFSENNLFSVIDPEGKKFVKPRWEFIQEALLQPINSSRELEIIIRSYNKHIPKFAALHNFFEEILEEEETNEFFTNLLPAIIRLALQLPEILPGNVPLLKQGVCKSISLSQLQISSLLANAFLCTFPWHKDIAVSYPGINFLRLFSAHSRPKREQAVAEKLKCICHYFNRITTKVPVGVVTFERKFIHKSQIPRWDNLNNILGNTKIHLASNGVIEDDGDGLLQVDFANKNVGGGVLGFGCVQEEIRYIICPELIVSRLFTEQLGPTESLLIIGAERYSSYSGYGDTFLWSGNFQDETPYDEFGRRQTNIVAIDALRFTKPMEQYHSSSILRELNKAFAGFHSRCDGRLAAVATGNWGCGAFKGNPKLKWLIQLMACSAARRDMVYFTFGDVKLRDDIYEMYLFLEKNQITISQLWKYLCKFTQADSKSENLFSYIQQAHASSKNQLSIKDIFCFNKRKVEKSYPSTSNYNNNETSDLVQNIKSSDTSNSNEKISCDHIIDLISSDSDSDVIGSSQPEEEIKHFEDLLKERATKCLEKKVCEREDVLSLTDLFDEQKRPDKVIRNDNVSLLPTIDKVKSADSKIIHTLDRSPENMETDEVIEHSIDMKTDYLCKSDKHLLKQKITDYFVKIDKG